MDQAVLVKPSWVIESWVIESWVIESWVIESWARTFSGEAVTASREESAQK
jgi:hypothetical protein